MSPHPSSQQGLSPVVAAGCRQFLADHLDGSGDLGRAHLAGCSACRTKLAAAEALGAMLRVRPSVPPELASPDLLEDVYERAVAMLEQTPLTAELSRRIPGPAAELTEPPASLLESATAKAVLVQPRMPSEMAWVRVRQSVRANAQSVFSRQQVLRRLPLAMAVVAASVAIAFVVQGSSEHAPAITFADLSSPPSLEMTILRHGPGH